MSAQPNVDARQIQHHKMKLAMAVGNKRHYVINSVAPRHFIQTGEAAGIPAGVTVSLLQELLTQMPDALDRVEKQMPSGFPAKLAKSIGHGVLQRLALIEKTPEIA
jgi:serine/threonine-protein kinase HipA